MKKINETLHLYIVRHRSQPMFQTPGPGAYSPEATEPTTRQPSPPAYSFGTRHQNRSTDSTPGLYGSVIFS